MNPYLNCHIILLGAGGFIGSRIASVLKERSIKFSIVSRHISTNFSDYSEIKWENFIDESFTNYFDPKQLILINCIGEVRNEEKMMNVNIDFVKILIQLNNKYKFNKIIHLSSAGIYKKARVVTYDSEISPCNFYEWTKFMADELLLTNNSNQNNIQIIRPTTVIGDGMPRNTINYILKIYQKIFFHFASPSKTYFHFVSVDIVAEICLQCVTGKLKEKILLISTDTTHLFFRKNVLKSRIGLRIPFFFYQIVRLILPYKLKNKIGHLVDKCNFESNIFCLKDSKLISRSLENACKKI